MNFLVLFVALLNTAFSQDHYETAVFHNDIWNFNLPESELNSEWNNLDYDDSEWESSFGGFGYGDNDDGTEIAPTLSIYLRNNFQIADTSKIYNAILNADYDDGFIAYLNGIEICRSENLGSFGTFIPFDSTGFFSHEAQLYQGGVPDYFIFRNNEINSLINEGNNCLAIQVHNSEFSSSDMSSNFFLTFGIQDSSTFYEPPPEWFQEPFTKSNLPIVIIDTFSEEILDEPKISAFMGIIDNNSMINNINDQYNGYSGEIGIEIRGSSSQIFPKKQYALETRDANGNNLNISILGMPEENDWILHAPYSDKSLIRNYFTYELSRQMGRYASRTRFCEVVLNGDYKGLYIFMEKIKRDSDRVNISKLEPDETSGDDLTGGYIIKIDKGTWDNNYGWYSESPLPNYNGRWYLYHYPKPDEIVDEQKEYIINYITGFENVMSSDSYNDISNGYYDLVDLSSFIDISMLSEIAKNIDAYRLSAYMYKDKDSNDPRLKVGPVWDYNLAYGNADYFNGWEPVGWQIDIDLGADYGYIPFWWYRMWADPIFLNSFKNRWQNLRSSVFSLNNMMSIIDSATTLIDQAQRRNFQRWPILNTYVWPNAYIGGNYENEINYLKGWIVDRAEWMDSQSDLMAIDSKSYDNYRIKNISPNPFNAKISMTFIGSNSKNLTVKLYNVLGKEVATLIEEDVFYGERKITWDGSAYSSGTYFIKLTTPSTSQIKKVMLLK